MVPFRQGRGNTTTARSSRPILTIDTRAPPKPGIDFSSSKSAPVGTRQEQGIPPMYQHADRYCTKVAEMMNTPTWRSQRPGPAIVDDSTSHSPIEDIDYPQASDHRKENNFDGVNNSFHDGKRQKRNQHIADEAYLGYDGDGDGEAMSILGIHPFLETPETPESSADTFLISASVCHSASSPIVAVLGEIHSLKTPKKRAGIQSKTAEDEEVSERSREDDCLCDYKESTQSSPRSVSNSPSHIRARKQKDNEEHMAREEEAKEKVRDIHELMGRDEAIESVGFDQISPRRQRPATPEEERRFRGLLGRLQPQRAGDQAESSTLVDPAIISFAKKHHECRGGSNLMAQLRAAEERYLEEHRHRTRSDSGYESPTIYSRPSTRAQSRIRKKSSDNAGAEPLSIQHQKFGSNDSGFDSPSKHSTLNPAAKEFSFTSVASGSPTKRGRLARPPVSADVYSQPQQHRMSNPYCPSERLGAGFQAPGIGGLPNHVTGPISHTPMPALTQNCPNILSQTGNFPNAMLPPPPGLGFPGAFPSLGGAPGLVPGLAPPPGFGVPAFCSPPGLASTPGLVPPGPAGPFHPQVPVTASCNNPAHQSISPFNSAHISSVPPITPLPPPAPPVSLVPQITNAPLPPPAAPAAPVAVPFIRKNVPKPKVPNTTGQQHWEYVHEMRRMYEPGYAQKSKANQQKRFMKQLNKSEGMVGQS
ncbi:hypothetical protein VM1G_09942 [Cytospora mali]|uniref:Uncharacterized protein n=1 Tax=Cytospora mali TaxID=578113 RepID=A0A194WD82_CYTMA|nr:hypothetical protein VM1G_09942 [Valsa mali]